MMRLFKHILVILTAVLLTQACSGEKDKVIPRSKLAEIYAEMFVTDQWLVDNPKVRRIADTSLVYQPILEKYGYTAADYRKSVDKYMDDPERYSRILRSSAKILEGKIAHLEKRKKQLEHEAALKLLRESMKIEVMFDIDGNFPYLRKEPYVHYYDSLAVEPDSMMIYRFRNIDRGDTIYRDLRMVILDSLKAEKADSVQVIDTVKAVEIEKVEETVKEVKPVQTAKGKDVLRTAGKPKPLGNSLTVSDKLICQ